MLRKVVTVWLMALTVATFAYADPASAKHSGPGHVSVGNRWQPASTHLSCADGNVYFFSYTQRITVDGESTMAPVETVAAPGRYDAILVDSCDGFDIYYFGTCVCRIVAVNSST